MAADIIKASQASFVIGPPVAPEELKQLYRQAGARAGGTTTLLARKLAETRKESVTVFSTVTQNGKSLLQRMLEGVLRKELARLEATVSERTVRGDLVPCLTISLQKSAYADGQPLSTNLTKTVIQDLEGGLRMAFKAEWVQSVVS